MAFRPSMAIPNTSSPPGGNLRQDLDLSILPWTFVIPTHLSTDELQEIEESLIQYGAAVTYDATEARLFLGKLTAKKRAQFELRSRKVLTEEISGPPESPKSPVKLESEGPPQKRRRVSVEPLEQIHYSKAPKVGDSSTELAPDVDGYDHEPEKQRHGTILVDSSTEPEGSDLELEAPDQDEGGLHGPKLKKRATATRARLVEDIESSSVIVVLKVQWLSDSISGGVLLPLDDYIVYEGQSTGIQLADEPSSNLKSSSPRPKNDENVERIDADAGAILDRARADTPPPRKGPSSRFVSAPHGSRRFKTQGYSRSHEHHEKPKLLEEQTASQEGREDGPTELPPLPEWVRQKLKYACQRVTPANSPNDEFIDMLKRIRLARELTGDEIGIRAYSTSIAAIAAYPWQIGSPKEILRLPGCDVKIANLWIEWKNSGKIEAAEEVEGDETMRILKLFYDIWGVGAHTAREFYFDRGWRDLNDVIEYGWSSISRVQQIGVKYYDEFQQGIPRPEVEFILERVKEHAIKVRDDGIEAIVVGGYRRGKEESGDVDIIVSHRHLDKTANLVTDIVASLEDEGWVTHTLLLALTSTSRDQSTLPFKSVGVASYGSGFDTLDKALVVWQDISWPNKQTGLLENPKAKNPNIHRRVDIIVSPWRTVGCAVTGWSGGTTFQRDLRRYAKYVKGWKFDSSGVRDRRTGEVIRLEGIEGVDGGLIDAEKKVFEGMGLEYREPWERCTG